MTTPRQYFIEQIANKMVAQHKNPKGRNINSWEVLCSTNYNYNPAFSHLSILLSEMVTGAARKCGYKLITQKQEDRALRAAIKVAKQSMKYYLQNQEENKTIEELMTQETAQVQVERQEAQFAKELAAFRKAEGLDAVVQAEFIHTLTH